MPQSPALITPTLVSLNSGLPDTFADLAGAGNNQRPADTLYNSIIALQKLGLDCSYNIFRNEFLISGKLLTEDVEDVGELSDLTCIALRQLIRQNFLFEPSTANINDAVRRCCTMRTFHPIKDYLEGVPRWDGIPRVDSLLPEYFNAPNTPFNRAVSRIIMIASVRRIYKPGTKFDYMTVLQSAEGFNKSSAIEALYGEDHFTDTSTIGLGSKEVEETLRGQWAQENPELHGLSKADWNKLKGHLSKRNDRGRHAYGRNPVDGKRTAIQWGTSNDDAYLRALTGENRRFFSVDVLSAIDIAKLMQFRDDLWAEAVEIEATGESCMLPEKYWADAAAERAKRTEIDPWEDTLSAISEHGIALGKRTSRYELTDDGEERVSNGFLFEVLGFSDKDRNPMHGSRIARVMKKQGWEYSQSIRIGGKHTRGYRRPHWAELM
jgi:predicted P-loop ATPase